MGHSLVHEESIAAIAESVSRFCATINAATGFASRWKGLAELGLFSLPELIPESKYAAMAAALEVLGRRDFFGPVADTLTFAACAPADLLGPVSEGEVVACFGQLPLVPYPQADTIHVTEHEGNATILDIAAANPVEMLSGDPWARVEGKPARGLGPFGQWADCYDIAISAWLVGSALDLVEAASAHAAQRVQFGRPIGEFQAVSGPLARAVLALDAAKVLVEVAAARLDAGENGLVTAARWSAARAAEQVATTAHQTYGAFGVLESGPVYARSRRIRQMSAQFPQERPVDAHAALGPGALALIGRQ